MSPEAAEAYYITLDRVPIGMLAGFWRGRAVETGHPVDELLRASSWIGKDFLAPEEVCPLVHEGAFGRFRLDPGLVPLALARRLGLARLPGARAGFRLLGPLLGTRKPRARLRMIEDRGCLTAAMIYDQLPIIDIFRKVDGDTVMGRMDERGQRPAYFLLSRE